jgi:diguanylate cyclase (GGDEF)-like protein
MRNALIVDDSVWIHSLVRSQLGKEYSLQSAFDGTSGLEQAAKLDPEFILLDIDLPDMHGYDVCRKLKTSEATRRIPVIFLTSSKEVNSRVGGLNIGACDYITKPFEPLELKARVHAIVRERQGLREAMAAPVLDSTTGLFNQRYLETRLEGEIARARRSGHTLACILVQTEFQMPDNHTDADDVDSMHEDAMRRIVGAVLQACRKEDVICRYDQDTFGILAVAQNRDAARTLAERLQDHVKVCEAAAGESMPPIKVSIGVGLSRFSTGMAIVYEATEALAKARHSTFGKIVIGSEFVQLKLAG